MSTATADEAATVAYLADKFITLFEGQGGTRTEQMEDALRRASQVMCNLEPLLANIKRQLPNTLANA
jgi:hypothetical protein